MLPVVVNARGGEGVEVVVVVVVVVAVTVTSVEGGSDGRL